MFTAIDSVPDGGIILSTTPEVKEWFEIKYKGDKITEVLTSEKNTYQTLANAGIEFSKTVEADYISILEFDDHLTPNAHRILNEYMDVYEDADILAPLACVVKQDENSDKPTLLNMINEACYAGGIPEAQGYFDFNMLLRTNFMFVNGCYIKPSVFEEFGGFKENFRLFYDYEWILRMVYNGAVIRGIPKATHFHYMTPDGAFSASKKESKDVAGEYLKAVRREYFFEEDRELNLQ